MRSRLRLLTQWGRVGLGRSYAHLPQDRGPHFAPGRLEGYFVDLSGKADWRGPVDPAGASLYMKPLEADGRKTD